MKYPYIETTRTVQGITFIDNKDGSISISGTVTEVAYYNLYSNIDGKRLTLASGTYKLVVKGRSKCDVIVSNDVSTAVNAGTFTITDGHNEIYCYIAIHEGLTVDETQFETATLPYTLNAIPVKSGGNYTDQYGQQWICDEVDLERGMKVQRIYNVDVDGENVKFEQSGVYANLMPGGLPIALYNVGQGTFAISTFISSSWFFNIVSGQFLYLIGADIADKINESCKKQLGKIHYVLATPIETDLMPEEIEQYKKLSTRTPTTIVENNYNTWMKATYKSIESV